MILGLIRPHAGTAAIAGKPCPKLASPANALPGGWFLALVMPGWAASLTEGNT